MTEFGVQNLAYMLFRAKCQLDRLTSLGFVADYRSK